MKFLRALLKRETFSTFFFGSKKSLLSCLGEVLLSLFFLKLLWLDLLLVEACVEMVEVLLLLLTTEMVGEADKSEQKFQREFFVLPTFDVN